MLLLPRSVDELVTVLRVLADFPAIPIVVLGGGANVLVSDSGVRGAVIGTSSIRGMEIDGDSVSVGAGMTVSDAAWELGRRGRAGLHFLYAMPGSTGGAVWMNARCYGSEVSDVLESVDLVDFSGRPSTYQFRKDDFSYKVSPFQSGTSIIVGARFRTWSQPPELLAEKMVSYRDDRKKKGHFSFPSAGSIFKNDHAFGAPSGKIIDSLGLRGYRIGDAKISDDHGNIFVNAGNACARDMHRLIRFVQARVLDETGFTLEPEVRFLGDWD